MIEISLQTIARNCTNQRHTNNRQKNGVKIKIANIAHQKVNKEVREEFLVATITLDHNGLLLGIFFSSHCLQTWLP